MKIADFADVIMVDILTRRYANQKGRWIARFERAEIKDSKHSSILSGEYGEGKCASEAIADYAKKISGKFIVINAGDKERRREYCAPQLAV